ncbi:DUF5010 domain-containing protein [Agrobacterium rhizogenes]|uniref:DUF5010 domain-containing protein n=1 Tax=Rhizobium rhizogenes TaxID=359 RepID=UPI00157495B0|nr:DUF5010 domain-containing protein [Rhizobium rhizogenes]NTG86220.1 DUF5010 domain-containing protein [Rhizobium rhizogenes]
MINHPIGRRQFVAGASALLSANIVLPGTVKAAFTSEDSAIRFIYESLLYRAPAEDEAGQSIASQSKVQAIIESDEYRRLVIQDTYLRFLGRPADPSGLDGSLHSLQTGGKWSDLVRGLLASEEYYVQRGGGWDRLFVSALNLDLYASPADETSESMLGLLKTTGSRVAVVDAMLANARFFQSEALRLWAKTTDTPAIKESIAKLAASVTHEALVSNLVLDLSQKSARCIAKPDHVSDWSKAPGPWVTTEALSQTFKKSDRLLCTTFFYWYDPEVASIMANPDNPRGGETGEPAFSVHPIEKDLAQSSYRNLNWHHKQISDMAEAGIDFMLPVYFGTPFTSQFDLPAEEKRIQQIAEFSDVGLQNIVRVLDERMTKGLSTVKVGMFYDTTSIKKENAKAWHADLSTKAGKQWFYETIRNFFSQVPPTHRAQLDGKPIVFIYHMSFGQGITSDIFPYVRARFQADFGQDLHIVTGAEVDAPRITDPQSIVVWRERLATTSFDRVVVEMMQSPEFRNRSDGTPGGFTKILYDYLFNRTPSDAELVEGTFIFQAQGSETLVEKIVSSPDGLTALLAAHKRYLLDDHRPLSELGKDADVLLAAKGFATNRRYQDILAEFLCSKACWDYAGGDNASFAEYLVQKLLLLGSSKDCAECASFTTSDRFMLDIKQKLENRDRRDVIAEVIGMPEARTAIVSYIYYYYLGRFNAGVPDDTFSWASAIRPLIQSVASVGAGYNQTGVPNRPKYSVHRDDGRRYREVWGELLKRSPAPTIVHVETWNEFFEGTAICETREYGRTYIDLTRELSDKFKKLS